VVAFAAKLAKVRIENIGHHENAVHCIQASIATAILSLHSLHSSFNCDRNFESSLQLWTFFCRWVSTLLMRSVQACSLMKTVWRKHSRCSPCGATVSSALLPCADEVEKHIVASLLCCTQNISSQSLRPDICTTVNKQLNHSQVTPCCSHV